MQIIHPVRLIVKFTAVGGRAVWLARVRHQDLDRAGNLAVDRVAVRHHVDVRKPCKIVGPAPRIKHPAAGLPVRQVLEKVPTG